MISKTLNGKVGVLIMIYLIKIFILITLTISSSVASNTNNKILFKINNKAFTKIDLEKRIKYINITNNLNIKNINDPNVKNILKDYESSLIFYEYYISENIKYNNFREEANILFEKNILSKINNQNLNQEEILNLKNNLELDIVRKKIIEDMLNLRKKNLTKEPNYLDLIYNYNLSYLTVKKSNLDNANIKDIKNRDDFNNFKKILSNNNINFLFKNDDINESSIISKLIKEVIKENKKIHYEYNNDFLILISIEKKLESYDGIFVKLINFKLIEPLKDKNLNCNKVKQLIDIKKTVYKEYEYKQLNDEIKNNLKSVNDFIIYKNNNNYNYIFLCELRYDEELLTVINFNKKVDWLANKIQINFLNKYKNAYNYQKIK